MEKSVLENGEPHPLANSALRYVWKQMIADPSTVESIASSALSGNRSAEICAGTIQRLRNKEPVSDRYLLGLAWMLKMMEENAPPTDDGAPMKDV